MKYEPPNEQRDGLRQRRESVEQLLQHVDDLDRTDRALLRGVHQHGMAATDLADVIGQQPRTVRKRIGRLVERINSPEFRYVIRLRHLWPQPRRAIVERVFLRGRSQREAAAGLGISVHRVRQECHRIRHAVELAREHRALNASAPISSSASRADQPQPAALSRREPPHAARLHP